ITTEYSSHQTKVSSSDDAELINKLTHRLTELEKKLNTLKQVPSAPQPTSQPRRATPRANKNSYNIPYEQIHQVLGEAEKSALQHVNSNWGTFLGQLKTTNAPAHATIQDSKPAAASHQALVVAFRYEIHCSLFLDNRETIESILGNVLGKQLTIIPIPAPDWQKLRSEYISKQEHVKQGDEENGETDALVEEARKLVGDDLLEIHD